MPTPIKVITTQERYDSYYTALIPDQLEFIGHAQNRYEAICAALTKAGLLEIIDVAELRQRSEKKETEA